MGKASKRKSSKGRGEKLPEDLVNVNPIVQGLSYPEVLTQVLNGEILLYYVRLEDESGHGGDMLLLYKISELSNQKTNVRIAYETAIQKNVINLGIRRQQEQGKGLLSLIDIEYRRLLGVYDNHMYGFVFNWFTISELVSQKKPSLLFGNTNGLQPIALTLAQRCDPVHEFPCLFSGVPLDENGIFEGKFSYLLFMVKDDNVPSFEVDIKMNEKFI